jgi:predicted ATPase
LIEALAADGIANMPEAGRAIIQDQVAIGGDKAVLRASPVHPYMLAATYSALGYQRIPLAQHSARTCPVRNAGYRAAIISASLSTVAQLRAVETVESLESK